MPGEGIPPSRPNNLFADAGSIAVLGLVLLGVIGLAYQMLRPGGWLWVSDLVAHESPGRMDPQHSGLSLGEEPGSGMAGWIWRDSRRSNG